jgi:hypothetical protein
VRAGSAAKRYSVDVHNGRSLADLKSADPRDAQVTCLNRRAQTEHQPRFPIAIRAGNGEAIVHRAKAAEEIDPAICRMTAR